MSDKCRILFEVKTFSLRENMHRIKSLLLVNVCVVSLAALSINLSRNKHDLFKKNERKESNEIEFKVLKY